jgi:hypothetical protein
MTVLRQFLSRREAEILEQIKGLEEELAEIRTTWSALQAEGVPAPKRATPTIKEMIRRILRGRPDGLTASEILLEMEVRFSTVVERTSLSPQLSRLKEADEVILKGGRWFLAQIPHSGLSGPDESSAAEPALLGGAEGD